jgi:hypothetical protein
MVERKAGFRRISDVSVREKTGKDWSEWYRILDEWGMKERGHTLTDEDSRSSCGALVKVALQYPVVEIDNRVLWIYDGRQER